ncbi:GNAT family N-acetyltransferase [Raoultibacter massiliensis]|uniref:GNAT family N-acetyltransferase n=1 Tax=Raoultibacter massiliensis TaxID=1852371 RepID=UPI000C855A0C|nr:GNAT family N-acetyltransferase [Raoultibacter massiliensis]
MTEWVLETERLGLRKLAEGDFADLCAILQDEQVMYAYEHAFSDEEVQKWLDNQLGRYDRDGFGLWAVILKEGGSFIGQCGLTMQEYGGERVVEVGYLFARAYWHRGYATEAARACRDYAFAELGVNEVFSLIRTTNEASKRVAVRNGMVPRGEFSKHYHGIDMPHIAYSVTRAEAGLV